MSSSDIITRVVQDSIEYYTVNATGESGLSQSGLARLCDVDESTIRRLLDSLRRKTVHRRLQPLLGKDIHLGVEYTYKQYRVNIVRAEVCATIIKYYAFDGKEVAEYSLEKFAAVGINTWIQGITGYIPQPSQQQQVPQIQSTAYAQRLLHRDDHIVPFGYWSIFNEGAKVLIYVEQELKLPVGEYDLIDGSMGKRWPPYRKDQPWCCPTSSYMHHYRDQRGSRACHAYDDAELKYFRSWLDEEYIPIHMPVYLKKKYSGYIIT